MGVIFILFMKAETENVGEIELRSDINLRISVKNSLSEETRENIVFNRSETVEQYEGDREAPYHFSLRWEGSKKPSILRALNDKEIATALKKKKKYKGGLPRKFTGDDGDCLSWVPLCAFECRGLEPYAFHPMTDEFVITSENGFRFDEDIELEDNEWADYDAENDVPVSIQDVEFKFEAV
ncbi:hypothetical protein FRACYDRAFT_207458 [Fragilariopsis cylindrus CCMP1102]|uniref:DUF866-domain-containing protein n=1 Tax=Fragilariopsis cylindrus CCMP1102 TaxID=635003 RepID=A0A1E7FG28_9STRA|nr:hypothetical protein FRACYDRAFT_207458 [Fragilariopsis cylindrus CCMP1102]|eukprot:OEU17130.1 hypothetical protein FRACYDRAFT_207458 [Fragilariopsis cylindrus CCMP1102]